MAPQGSSEASWMLFESDSTKEDKSPMVAPKAVATNTSYQIMWRNVFIYILMHLGALYGGYLFLVEAKWASRIFAFVLYVCGALGITAGAHRLWAHKAYSANWPLRFILVIFSNIAFQESVIDWARDHRTHHKYSETDADPHNATRGFFFSHVGWLLVKKHPEVVAKGAAIDISDLLADPMLRFQKKHYKLLVLTCCFVIPTLIPLLWGETLWNAFFVCTNFRYVWLLNVTWLVNSAAHMFGNKPYEKKIRPAELIALSPLVLGEGYHNYHHTFPWDYKASELNNYMLNFTTLFLDTMAKIGWAWNLKTVNRDVVEKRAKATGDGTHEVWGWDDKDVPQEHKDLTQIINPQPHRHTNGLGKSADVKSE